MTRSEAIRFCAALAIAVLAYFLLEFVTWRAYYAVGCERMSSPGCINLLHVKHLVAAALPAYLAGWWIGRWGMALGAAVSLGGWLIVHLAKAMLGPDGLDAWHLVSTYAVIGALAGGIGHFHRPPRGSA